MAGLKTPPGVLSFPALLAPRVMPGQTEAFFSMVLVFDSKQVNSELFKALRAEAKRVADERWAGKMPPNLRSPFRKNSEKADQEPFATHPDGMFLSFRSKNKPGIVDEARGEILTVDEIWSGQIWRASVRAFAYEKAGNRGVSFALLNCQRLQRDCKRMDGRLPPELDFDAVEGYDSAVTDDQPFFATYQPDLEFA